MKRLLIVSLLLAAASPAQAAVCSARGTTVVLVDRTVDDREALASETKAVFDQLLEEIWSKGESYFNSKIELVSLDDQGEHAATWQLQLPKHYGMQKSEMKGAMGVLAERIKGSLAEIRADTRKYTSSMILEGVSRQLGRLGPCDRIVVLSDLCVVDKSGNNFERLVFNDPRRLPGQATVELKRMGRPQQPLESIELIEAWWRDTLYGDGKFKELYAAHKARKGSAAPPSKEPAFKPKAPAPRPASLSSEAPSDLTRANEARIMGDISKLSDCLDTDGVPKNEQGTYRLKIYVEATGTPAKIEPMSGVSKKIRSCLVERLMGMTYALHPARSSYFFFQAIEVGLPKSG